MPTITTPGGNCELVVSEEDFAAIRELLDRPERLRALIDLADAQLDLEQVIGLAPAPPPLLRVVGPDGAVEHPIACRRAIQAQAEGRERPACRWKRDPRSGYVCVAEVGGTKCGCWVGPEMARHDVLERLFGDGDPNGDDHG